MRNLRVLGSVMLNRVKILQVHGSTLDGDIMGLVVVLMAKARRVWVKIVLKCVVLDEGNNMISSFELGRYEGWQVQFTLCHSRFPLFSRVLGYGSAAIMLGALAFFS